VEFHRRADLSPLESQLVSGTFCSFGSDFNMKLMLLLLLLAPALASATQSAKVTLDLDVSPGFQNAIDTLLVKTNIRKYADHCNSHVEVNYAGPKNHRIVSSEYTLAQSMTSGKVKNVEVELDPASAPNDRKLELYEHCRYSETEVYSCPDSNGGTTTCTRTNDYDAILGWKCDFKGLAEVAKTEKMSCQFEMPKLDYRFQRGGLSQALVNKVAATNKFELAVETKTLEKKASATVMRVNGGRKVWVRLLEGVTGHMGENDFEYQIDLDGEKLTAKIPDGQLNYDIEYHTNAQSVNVAVSAVERDLIFDDYYVPQNRLTLTTKPPGNTGKIALKRRTYFGEWFTSKDHQVTVIVTEDEPQQLDLDTAAILALEVTKREAAKDWGRAIAGTTRALKAGEEYKPVESDSHSGSWEAQ
jgi:hypothetical protein